MQGIFSQELVTRVKEEGGSQSQAEDPGGEPEIGNSRNPLPDPGLGERVGGRGCYQLSRSGDWRAGARAGPEEPRGR